MSGRAGMGIRRIVFTGDFLRPGATGAAPSQHYNIQWLHDLLGRQMAEATGLPFEMLAWNHAGVVSGRLDAAAVEGVYASLGLPRSIASWAALYNERDLPAALSDFLAGFFRDALVVAFEMPPYLEGVLARAGIPFVDAIIHPVRFLDDVFLAFRSSDGAVNAALARHAAPEEQIWVMAGVQSAAARRLHPFSPAPGSALLLLQTRFDRTQIRDGAFVGAIDFLDRLAEVAARVPTLLVKEHPLEPQNHHCRAVLGAFRNAELTRDNVYRLMANDHVAEVITLSSSAGIEARYFCKRPTFLLGPPNAFALDGAVPEGDQFVGVLDGFLAPDFWRQALSPLVPTTAPSGVRIPFKPNRLRGSIRSFWNFNEIDTDFAVGLAKAAG